MALRSRRDFLKTLGSAVALAPLASLLGVRGLWPAAAEAADAPAEGLAACSDAHPVASALGYKADIKNIDYKKYPQRKKPDAKNQFCNTCALYTAANPSWGKCSMMADCSVAAKGWCASYSKKA